MMMTPKAKKVCAIVLTGALTVATVLSVMPAEGLAAKKASIGTKKISIQVGKKKKISIKGTQKKHTYTFTSKDKKIATVSSKGVVTGVKAGTTTITVTDNYKKKKKKKSVQLGKVTVTVTNAKPGETAPPESAANTNTQAPAATQTSTNTQAPAVSAAPTEAAAATPEVPTPTPTINPDDILNLWPDEEIDPESTKEPDTPNAYYRSIDGATYGEMQEIIYTSKTTGVDRKANVLLPPDYNEDIEYPVLYLLHGLDGDHNEWKDNGNPIQIIGNLINAGEAHEMIVVMANARARANDAGGPADRLTVEHFQAFNNFKNDLLVDLMPYMKEHYSIAEGRENTAIAGLSMGGRTALYIGISEPEIFGYVGAFSPAVGVLPYDTEPEGLFKPDEFKLPDLYNGKNFVMICTANVDSVVHEVPVEYAQKLIENGTKIMFFMRQGGDHNWDTWRDGLYHFAKRIFTQIY